MNMEIPSPEKPQAFTEFSDGAFKLHQAIFQLDDSLDTNDPLKGAINISGRVRAETAANLLTKLPATLDESMLEYRKEVLIECRQGIRALNSENPNDKKIKEEALEIIKKLESF